MPQSLLAMVITLKELPGKEKLTDNNNTKYNNNTNLTDSNKKGFFQKPSLVMEDGLIQILKCLLKN